MKRVIEDSEIEHLEGVVIKPEEWTAIIPLAGKGTRLGFDKPKALFPILGKPLLGWILDALDAYCSHFVLIVSPGGEAGIREFVTGAKYVDRITFRIQPEPRGMADAVYCARDAVGTRHSLVIWGDQIALRKRTIELTLKAHQARPHAKMTLPTLIKDRPYISIIRDDSGKMLWVKQARESEIDTVRGENDCGLFLFDTEILFHELERAREENRGLGDQTGELNLLPLLPRFDQFLGDTVSLRIASDEETIGVNTLEEAGRVGRILELRC